MRGLDWQTWQIRFTGGLNQKADPRTLEASELTICKDVAFDKIGALHTRHPFAARGTSILGGGTVANFRRLVPNGDELILFTKDALYSWNAQQSKWVSRGEHLAVKTSEQTVFATTGDQQAVDRAELGNVILYVWQEPVTTAYLAQPRVYAAAVDKTTGATILPPTQVSTGTYARAPRVVALATKFLVFFQPYFGIELRALALDPTDITAATVGAAGTQIIAATSLNLSLNYDVVKIPGADTALLAARRNPTTSYELVKVTSALAVTSATKARTCDGPIAVSCTPDGASVQIARANGTNVQGDLITISTLADVYTAQAVGTSTTTIYQIAAAHRSVQDGGQYRCYVFWGVDEEPAGGAAQVTKMNWVDTGNTLGAQALFQPWMSVASRAFDYNGRVFFWGIFNASSSPAIGGRLQGTYFLFRDDGRIVAKAAAGNAYWAALVGFLPGVALTAGTTTFSWAGCFARNVEVTGGESGGFRGRAPRDIMFTFDADEARRVARFGNTLYIAGAEIMQYDGAQLAELGFHVAPYRFDFVQGGAGNVEIGTYGYNVTLRWLNAAGEIDRSTSFGADTVTVAGSSKKVTTSGGTAINSIWTTHKTGVAVEVWRTAKNPTAEAPLYLVTNQDPSVPASVNDNGFIYNDLTAASEVTFVDDYADATATTLETNPENGGVLENIAPPPATIIAATQNRLFLAGIAGLPDQVWYSKQREVGKVAGFSDALTIDVPKDGGDITAIAFMLETLVVFREHAVYAFPGDGFDNTGNGQNYGPARIISLDVGATSHEAVAVTDQGLVFHSNKGKWVLNKGWQLEPFGVPVVDYDSETPLAVHAIESKHEIRWLTSSRMLVFNTLAGKWSEWSIADGLHAAMYQGAYQYLASSGPKYEQTDYAGIDFGMDVETAWVKLNDLQGFGRVRQLDVLGEYRSSHGLRVRLAKDYETTYFDDRTWTPSPTTVGGPEQVRHGVTEQQVQAIRVRITATTPTGESLRLTGVGLELGFKRGLYRRLPVAQTQ